MKRKLKNRDGYILATTLIVMVILTILGLALINLSSTEGLQSQHYEKTLQAKYLAKSGADIIADYIINNTDAFEANYLEKEKYFPYEISLNGEKVFVDIEKRGYGLDIISEGIFKKNKSKVNLFLKNTAVGNEPLFYTEIEKVDTAGTRYKNFDDILGIRSKNSIDMIEPNIKVEENKTITINMKTGSKEYKNIEVHEAGILELDTGGPNDRILIVDELKIDGYLKLSQDSGRVFLIVKNKAEFKNSYQDSENQLIIIGMDGSSIEIFPKTDKKNYLYIYSPFGITKLDQEIIINGAIIVSEDSGKDIDANNILYRALDKSINIEGYTFYDAKYKYVIDRYDKSFR